MAYSIQREVSDGTLVLLDISISYIERSEISVYFDDVLQTEGATWTWVGVSDAKLSFSPAVANGVEVTVKRVTDLSALRHRYSEGAAFTANSMDESFEQVLHIAQEATEGSLGGDFFQDINMHTYKIKNLGQATSPTDAVSLGQYQADAAGAKVARNEAVAAKNTAVAAKDTAVAAKDTAVASSTSAQGSASTATTQAGIATTKASEAAASADSALASKNSITASATDATASKNAAATSATAAANSAAAALNPWQVISPTEIRYIGKGGLYGAGNRLDFLDSNHYICASDGLALTSAGRVRIITAGGEQLRADAHGVGVQMPPVVGAGTLQTAYRSTVWARGPADTPHIDVIASDFLSLPSYKSVRLQYSGQAVAGNLTYCPSVPAANTAHLEALNTDALVIGTNNNAPVVVATAGLESTRALVDGNIDIGSNRPVAGDRILSVANYSSDPAAAVTIRTLCNGVSMALITYKAGSSAVLAYGGSLYVGTGTPATPMIFRQGGVDCAYFGSAGEFRIKRPQPFGYDVGAGGTVTQETNKSTNVTLNTPSGVIRTHAQPILSGDVADFTLFNSCITPTSVVCANAANHSSSYAIRYTVTCCVLQGGGGVRIRLMNASGVTLAEAVPINFVVINGASA